MDAATRYNNRYKAIIDAAQGAVINLAELEEWISSAGHSEEIPLKNIREREGWPFFHRLTHLISIEWIDRLPDSEVPAQLRQHAMLLAGQVVTDLKAATVLTSLSRALNEKKLLVALHEAKLDQLILGAVYDGELRLYREHGRNRQEMDFAQAKAEYDADPRAGERTEAIDYQKLKMPRPDAGQGASVEATTRTSLTPFLELETWTPLEGALLVCGVIPPANCHAIPHGAMSLGGVLLMPTDDPFHDARRVLQIWNSQMSPPEKVRPAEFVAWCRSKNINTDWLRDVPSAPAAPELRLVESSTLRLVDPAHTAGQSAVPTSRIKPQSGDALTPVIWDICYDLHDAGEEIKPRHVMAELRERAEKKVWPLLSVVAGGVKYERERGEEDELCTERLRARIKEWRKAITGE